jgi:hypothetical protein
VVSIAGVVVVTESNGTLLFNGVADSRAALVRVASGQSTVTFNTSGLNGTFTLKNVTGNTSLRLDNSGAITLDVSTLLQCDFSASLDQGYRILNAGLVFSVAPPPDSAEASSFVVVAIMFMALAVSGTAGAALYFGQGGTKRKDPLIGVANSSSSSSRRPRVKLKL